MKLCEKCGSIMIRAEMYDPDGEVPLYGGVKEYNEQGDLVNWFVCINHGCEDGKKNTVVEVK